MWEQGEYEETLYLPFSFAVNLKLLIKILFKNIYTEREKENHLWGRKYRNRERDENIQIPDENIQIPDENIQIPGWTSGEQLFSAEMKKEMDSQRWPLRRICLKTNFDE